jgi:hypothetical protein
MALEKAAASPRVFDISQMLPNADPACHVAQCGAVGIVRGLVPPFNMMR